MKQRNRSKEELRKASNALHYEVSMLRAVVNGLASGILGECHSPIRNALIESFATHVRVLIEFFYRDNTKKDTVLARHFFSPPNKWTKIRPAQSKTLSDAKTRSNKLLSHLTYTRSKGGLDKEWPVTEIANELETKLNIFLQNVPKGFLGSRWKTSPE